MYSQALSPLVISSNLYKPVLHVESSVETIGPSYCHFNYSISFRTCDATYDDDMMMMIRIRVRIYVRAKNGGVPTLSLL